MFTQSKKINVSRCNGCPKRCALGTKPVVLYDNTIAYHPTINNEMIMQYRDKQNRKHFIHSFTNKSVALSFAHTISKNCKKYITPPEQIVIPNILTHCRGCDKNCRLIAQQIQTKTQIGYIPSIDGKTINKYINKRGLTRDIPIYNDALKAFTKANKICKLCDNYSHQHTK